MSSFWISPDAVFEAGQVHKNKSLFIEDGYVSKLAPRQENHPRVSGIIAPGYVDLQVNGGGGVQLNQVPTAASMMAIAEAHHRLGTAAIMPTLITDDVNVLERAVKAAYAAKNQNCIAGLHIEGPHIALARRGTHAAKFVRPMDHHTIELVTKLRAHDVAVMLTLAPEAATTEQISTLAKTGAIISIGHTDATADQVEQAISAGANCGTHLFNAMSPMTSRAPGAVGAILNAGIYFGIICDGHHVDDRMISLALRAASKPQRAFLVSDAMATVGGPDHFTLYGQDIALENGRLLNAEGSLAGAHITQAEGVERLVSVLGIPIEEALQMAISTPANLIKRPQLAKISTRKISDLILVNANGRLKGMLNEPLNQIA